MTCLRESAHSQSPLLRKAATSTPMISIQSLFVGCDIISSLIKLETRFVILCHVATTHCNSHCSLHTERLLLPRPTEAATEGLLLPRPTEAATEGLLLPRLTEAATERLLLPRPTEGALHTLNQMVNQTVNHLVKCVRVARSPDRRLKLT